MNEWASRYSSKTYLQNRQWAVFGLWNHGINFLLVLLMLFKNAIYIAHTKYYNFIKGESQSSFQAIEHLCRALC